jgi:hypothetical protein
VLPSRRSLRARPAAPNRAQPPPCPCSSCARGKQESWPRSRPQRREIRCRCSCSAIAKTAHYSSSPQNHSSLPLLAHYPSPRTVRAAGATRGRQQGRPSQRVRGARAGGRRRCRFSLPVFLGRCSFSSPWSSMSVSRESLLLSSLSLPARIMSLAASSSVPGARSSAFAAAVAQHACLTVA